MSWDSFQHREHDFTLVSDETARIMIECNCLGERGWGHDRHRVELRVHHLGSG